MKYYNLRKVYELIDLDTAYITKMIQVFLKEVPEDLDALNTMVTNQNYELARSSLFKLKPNLELFGVPVTQELEQIEAWVEHKNITVEEEIDHLNKVIKKACIGLKEDFKQH
ncbi:HPt (histidine-containing phosphotransfer) domain-containing protein [Mesonia hippocampi]|uniref:HPt (Histidine-containing phosphotransfer) domain-containing protein n=1 Tax=Mesonia hippocampi TaxID=1628250 RepID=A0A840EPU1_9FLAO|nr:hypothetical protein [Mesonia hippocampi]MBB4119081.1 HPt (histidine-containing phosphotransfer) domain-containing protein [Mesonia hippocampi]